MAAIVAAIVSLRRKEISLPLPSRWEGQPALRVESKERVLKVNHCEFHSRVSLRPHCRSTLSSLSALTSIEMRVGNIGNDGDAGKYVKVNHSNAWMTDAKGDSVRDTAPYNCSWQTTMPAEEKIAISRCYLEADNCGDINMDGINLAVMCESEC
eukprot:2538955-Rhodomonas_salina.3